MKRRKAIRNIALVSSGIAFLPACQIEAAAPVFDNISLDLDQFRLLEWLTGAILPKADLEIETPETTAHFVLTMLNDCFDPEDIQRYVTGLKVFGQFITDKYETTFLQLNPEQNILLFTEITKSDLLPKSMKYFLSTTKQLTVRHFATSEYFMKNYLKFEFAPGRYLGCVS